MHAYTVCKKISPHYKVMMASEGRYFSRTCDLVFLEKEAVSKSVVMVLSNWNVQLTVLTKKYLLV